MTVKDNERQNLHGSRALQNALDAVGAIGDSGFVLVPSEPSSEMTAAGARAGRITPELARAVYRAMLGETD